MESIPWVRCASGNVYLSILRCGVFYQELYFFSYWWSYLCRLYNFIFHISLNSVTNWSFLFNLLASQIRGSFDTNYNLNSKEGTKLTQCIKLLTLGTKLHYLQYLLQVANLDCIEGTKPIQDRMPRSQGNKGIYWGDHELLVVNLEQLKFRISFNSRHNLLKLLLVLIKGRHPQQKG